MNISCLADSLTCLSRQSHPLSDSFFLSRALSVIRVRARAHTHSGRFLSTPGSMTIAEENTFHSCCTK